MRQHCFYSDDRKFNLSILTDFASLSGTLLQLRPFSVTLTPEFVRNGIALSQAPFSAFFNYLFPCKLRS